MQGDLLRVLSKIMRAFRFISLGDVTLAVVELRAANNSAPNNCTTQLQIAKPGFRLFSE